MKLVSIPEGKFQNYGQGDMGDLRFYYSIKFWQHLFYLAVKKNRGAANLLSKSCSCKVEFFIWKGNWKSLYFYFPTGILLQR